MNNFCPSSSLVSDSEEAEVDVQVEEMVNFKVSDTPGADLAFDDFVIDGATLMIPDIIKVDNEVDAVRPSPFPVCPGQWLNNFCPSSSLVSDSEEAEVDVQVEEMVNFKVSDTPGADLAFDDFVIDGATLMIPDIIKVDNEVDAVHPSPFPVCPGPAALSSVEALARPMASEAWDTVDPGLAEIYTQVTAHGVPNYRGARVRVPSALNIVAWREREGDLADQSLVDCLEYGFPIGFNGSQPPVSDIPNHSSARANPAQVRKYLSTEAEHLAIAGPFTAKPFSPWYRTNPLMTRPKRDSPDLRVILDLSFPKGEGVNSAIPVDAVDGAEFKLRLPTPLDLANRIRKLGRGCLLFKVDLSRAYRQLRSDPFDWPFLVQWDSEYFVDTAVPFGLRHGASACQRTTEAVVSLAKQDNDTTAHPYIDDTVAAALPDVADDQYTGLLRLMAVLGLMAAPHKSVPPCFQLIWIGVLFNTLAMSMSIDPARIVYGFLAKAAHEFKGTAEPSGKGHACFQVLPTGQAFYRENSGSVASGKCGLSASHF